MAEPEHLALVGDGVASHVFTCKTKTFVIAVCYKSRLFIVFNRCFFYVSTGDAGFNSVSSFIIEPPVEAHGRVTF